MNNYGWVCPKCQKVQAPHINSCSCSQVTFYFYGYPYIPNTCGSVSSEAYGNLYNNPTEKASKDNG